MDENALRPKPLKIDYVYYRSVKVDAVTKVDDLIGDTAVYIDDIKGPMDSVLLCGEILSLRERQTQAGKPYYLIEFSDRSGKITGTYFNKKTTEQQIRALKEGDGIIIQGNLEYYRDRLSLTIKKLNRCVFPADFVPEQRPSRGVPPEYTTVFPERITEYSQGDLFEENPSPPQCLMGKTFVVFDTETTGTDLFSDAITEIGAVKIEDGKITQILTTLVYPGRKIPPEVVEITGITDDMVREKPTFSDICGDVFKFFAGAILVAHNADFDMKFLKRLSGEEDYFYSNKYADTLELAREVLPSLHNHKLGTIAEHYGIEFKAHRALGDAYATAQAFIKLVADKGGLPALH